jgi:putative SOS response-associated peptidase YedK
MIEEYFDSVSGEDDWNPRYNIVPAQPVPIIRQNPKEPRRELSLVRWGFDTLVGEGHVRRGHDD